MHHSKYSYAKSLVHHNEPILLIGPAGTGKTTIAMQIAEDLSLPFHSISCTKQMSVSALLGFISINGAYIPTQLRHAYENGGVFLLDEMDAGDANVLLTLNTIENGFISFPDKIINAHKDFRIITTANPINAHDSYTGRSKLDLSTWDRYEKIYINRDPLLEAALTSQEHYEKISIVRKIFDDHGVSSGLTSRDIMRMYRIEKLGITDCIFKDIAFKDHTSLYNEFTAKIDTINREKAKASLTQSDATTIDELWDIIQREVTYEPHESENTDTFTADKTEYDAEMYAERTKAFDVVQDNISRNRKIPFGWNSIRIPTDTSDEYIIKGPRFTHKFLASEFIPF